jgi:phospholipase C
MLKRREFLRGAAALGAASMIGGSSSPAEAARLPGGSILDLPATSSPIDTIVVLMMENRSFDHYLGWLGDDATYWLEGRSRWGRKFSVEASTHEAYRKPDGTVVETYPLVTSGESNPWRGCGFGDPGHSWNAGRRQRDGGFLASGSNNDEFAVGFFGPDDLDFYNAITRRFTLFDRYHCSLLGPTYPNREYMHSAQSGGIKNNAFPFEVGYPNGFTWDTIWDRLMAAGVSCRYYYTDLPVTALWGARLNPVTSPLARYFEDAAAGTLPKVVFLDPGFLGDTRTDEHPHGDARDGQRLAQQMITAFMQSPHWERGVFFLNYDEWGGFFDHVRPPRFRDDRPSGNNDEDFRQAGFRVPTRMLSPYARQNFVDHRLYDHTSILRFIQWRFLGAPAEGRGRNNTWSLTNRDRFAKNIGWSLKPDSPDMDFDPPAPDPGTSPACGGPEGLAVTRSAATVPPHDFARGVENGFFEQMGYRIADWLPGR